MNITEPWIKPNERLEAEKPAEDAKRCAVLAWRSNERPGGFDWIESAALVIQSFAEAYHAKKCAICNGMTDDEMPPEECLSCTLQCPNDCPLDKKSTDAEIRR